MRGKKNLSSSSRFGRKSLVSKELEVVSGQPLRGSEGDKQRQEKDGETSVQAVTFR